MYFVFNEKNAPYIHMHSYPKFQPFSLSMSGNEKECHSSKFQDPLNKTSTFGKVTIIE